MGPGLVGEPRCGSQCRTFVRRLHTPVLAKHRRMLRSPYAVVLTYLLSEQSLTSLNGAPPSELHVTVSRHAAQAFTNAPRGTRLFGLFFLYVDLPVAVGMQQLQVVRRVSTTLAAPDAMMDLTVLLCQSQRLTAGHTSSLLFLPEILDLPVTCPRLGQLPTPPCFQVQFPLRIVGI
jgi:hypothetical protein